MDVNALIECHTRLPHLPYLAHQVGAGLEGQLAGLPSGRGGLGPLRLTNQLEGLDLPEVSLVAILDADKEGFLRSTRSLIQTFGRAARNINGTVVLYADRVTASMQQAIEEITEEERGSSLPKRLFRRFLGGPAQIEHKTVHTETGDDTNGRNPYDEPRVFRIGFGIGL